MSTRFHHTVALLALALACACAQAQDMAPTRAGRIALAQGQVDIGGELGDEVSQALVNWPVTSRNQITTGRDGRTEIRIGSTAVRLDADSALDVVELDDNTLRLHLHYGSATVRLRNPDLLRGFELTTPQAVIQFQEPGRMRIDAGRRQDTTVVSVFDGVALVDGSATRMTLRAGKRAEIYPDDFRTGLALRDSFDEWAMLRDERDDRSESVRYVTSEMTGYEDLDQNGVWRDDSEYGPLWSPRVMTLGWAPYRDGQWTFVQPWGWTWVDNAPWGYAPFHYGRWVMVNQRWCWAPGRNVSHVVWSPALVGWVGGSNWSLSFNTRGTHRAAPAQGWYPLAPHDTYVPTYRVDHDKLRYLNRNAGSPQPDIRGGHRREYDNQRVGLTVLPQEQFSQRGTVRVRGAPQVIASPSALMAAPVAAAPVAPLVVRAHAAEQRDGRIAPDPRRFERESAGRGIPRGPVAPVAAGSAAIELKSPPSMAPRPAAAAPVSPAATLFRRERDGRTQNDDGRRPQMETPNRMPAPAPAMPAPQVQAGVVVTQPQGAPAAAPQRAEQRARFERNDAERERRQHEREAEREARTRSAEPVQQPAPQARPSPLVQMVQRAPILPQAQPPQQPPQPQAARPAPPPAPAKAARPAEEKREPRDKNERER